MKIMHKKEAQKGKFVIEIDNKEAGYLKYEIFPNGNINANGTLVYDDYRDQKLGKPLFDELIDYARENKLKIYPSCPYVAIMFKKHPNLSDLLAKNFKP